MSAVTQVTWAWERPKAEFSSLFDQAPLGLAQCCRPGTITALNPALERMLGSTLNLHHPLFLADLLHTRDHADLERQILDLFDGKRESLQANSVSDGGDLRSLRWTAWRISGVNDLADSVLAMVEELPDGTQLEQRLRQAARLESLGKLAGGVAHDFNNVLTGVLLYCDLLMASLEPQHRARKYAEEIRNAGMQASALVRQLLALNRPPSVQPRLLSLNEIVEGMRDLLGRLVGENIELKFRLDAHLGLINLDTTQAQQILLNLVLNARDAMPKSGQIVVETRNCKLQALTESSLGGSAEASLPCALFVVEDSGCGMDEFTRAHMFEPFFTTKTGKGTGLGLATVQEVVTSNGGLIHVSSEPDRGTRVSVLLPLVPGTIPELAISQEFSSNNSNEIFLSQEEE